MRISQRGGTLKVKFVSRLSHDRRWWRVSTRRVVSGKRRGKEMTVKDTGGSHHDRRNDGRVYDGRAPTLTFSV